MRLVLDTNVVVAGLLWNGLPNRLIGLAIQKAVRLYSSQILLDELAQTPRVVANDADDDHVLACALAAQADLIVSGDKHLLGLGGAYQGIRIASPAEAVQLLNR
ncbi:MAG: putative toxin-antitoxin system toxin component, PIN family [Rhodocyclaceae bacterium]|nr:putative toxin-antitoxin system toxin component, PIN family [Rhodocyclaceae bacterium]